MKVLLNMKPKIETIRRLSALGNQKKCVAKGINLGMKPILQASAEDLGLSADDIDDILNKTTDRVAPIFDGMENDDEYLGAVAICFDEVGFTDEELLVVIRALEDSPAMLKYVENILSPDYLAVIEKYTAGVKAKYGVDAKLAEILQEVLAEKIRE